MPRGCAHRRDATSEKGTLVVGNGAGGRAVSLGVAFFDVPWDAVAHGALRRFPVAAAAVAGWYVLLTAATVLGRRARRQGQG